MATETESAMETGMRAAAAELTDTVAGTEKDPIMIMELDLLQLISIESGSHRVATKRDLRPVEEAVIILGMDFMAMTVALVRRLSKDLQPPATPENLVPHHP